MDDLISRQAAIANAISGRTREIDGEKWIRVSEVRESIKTLPPAHRRIKMINTIKEVGMLILNMSLRGATDNELRDAIEYSKCVVDLDKNYKYYNIEYLERKYSDPTMTNEHTE